MAHQFLPLEELPFLAKQGTAGVMISDDLTDQDEAFDHLNRLTLAPAPLSGSSWLSLLGQLGPAQQNRE